MYECKEVQAIPDNLRAPLTLAARMAYEDYSRDLVRIPRQIHLHEIDLWLFPFYEEAVEAEEFEMRRRLRRRSGYS